MMIINDAYLVSDIRSEFFIRPLHLSDQSLMVITVDQLNASLCLCSLQVAMLMKIKETYANSRITISLGMFYRSSKVRGSFGSTLCRDCFFSNSSSSLDEQSNSSRSSYSSFYLASLLSFFYSLFFYFANSIIIVVYYYIV